MNIIAFLILPFLFNGLNLEKELIHAELSIVSIEFDEYGEKESAYNILVTVKNTGHQHFKAGDWKLNVVAKLLRGEGENFGFEMKGEDLEVGKLITLSYAFSPPAESQWSFGVERVIGGKTYGEVVTEEITFKM